MIEAPGEEVAEVDHDWDVGAFSGFDSVVDTVFIFCGDGGDAALGDGDVAETVVVVAGVVEPEG